MPEPIPAKRFLVFDCPQYYPAGGFGDLVGHFDTEEEAEAAAGYDGEVVDLHDISGWLPTRPADG